MARYRLIYAKVNHKRVHRLYKLEKLNLRSKRPRRNRAGSHRLDREPASSLHECWSMDFVADQLFDGKKFRTLNIVDNYSRKCMDIYVDQGIKGKQVVDVLETIRSGTGVIPKKIRVDNGSEFISKALDKWAYDNQVILGFSRPGKPTDNAYIESFNGSFRDECLIPTGSYRCKMPKRKSSYGVMNIIPSGHIVP